MGIYSIYFVFELTVSFEGNFNWAHLVYLRAQWIRNGWITNVFLIEVGSWGFITNSNSAFLTNLELSPSDKRKRLSRIRLWLHQQWYGNPIEWHQSNKVWWYRLVQLGHSGLVVMMLWSRNHAWTQSSSDEVFVGSNASVQTSVIVWTFYCWRTTNKPR